MNLGNYQWQKILTLLKKLNINANNKSLYVEAMTHNSYNNEHKLGFTYQRLEFLGDVIISKIVSCYLFYLKFDEKSMTEIRKAIVNGITLKRASDELGLIDHAFLGRGVNALTETNKIREDLFESLMGAIYLDQGESKVYEILKNTIIKYYNNNDLQDTFDYKTKIQELLQKNMSSTKSKGKIHYTKEDDGNGNFKSTLYFGDIKYGTGFGSTRKKAENEAARIAYEKFVKPNINE